MSDRKRSPSGVVELVRLLCVVFFAGVGVQVAHGVSDETRSVLGPFTGAGIGIIVGSGIGYVLGGVLGRTTVTTVSRTETALREVTVDSLVGGAIGLVCGVLVGAGVGLPLFLIPNPLIAAPVYALVIVVLGFFGFRVGRAKREDMVAIFGGRAGMAPRVPTASAVPKLVDSSVAIDGRVLDVVRAGFLHGDLLICSPVLAELQGLADSADAVRRGRGRRGLETLEALRREPGVTVEVLDDDVPAVPEVDAKLVRLCLDRDLALLTLDTNLAKSAALAGVRVLNLHALALALRPPVQAGDEVTVSLLKPGRERDQAVGYLDDGTMVVAERSRALIGSDATVTVTSVLTTANGRMVFAQPAGEPAPRRRS